MKENDNIVEFNNESLSEQEMNAYLSMKAGDTPDLWSRIEAGFDEEVNEIKNNKKTDSEFKRRRKKYFGVIAACVIVTIIAIPVLIMSNVLGGGRSKNSAETAMDKVEDTENVKSDIQEIQEEPAEDTDGAPCATEAASGAEMNESVWCDTEAENGFAQEATNEESITDNDGMNNDTVYPANEADNKYVMYNDVLYEYTGTYVSYLPEGCIMVGYVESLDNENYPDENFEGTHVEIGNRIYKSASSRDVIYVQVSEDSEDGYEKFTAVQNH